MPIMARQDLATRSNPRRKPIVAPPATGPVNVQPSARPGNVMGRQSQAGPPAVPTGASPSLTTPAVQPANSAEPPSPVTGTPIMDAASGQRPTPPTTTTSQRVAQIAAKGGPLMQRAETQGRQYANERGLLNSSLAAGAAQGAVLDRATDLARSDVQDRLNQFYAGIERERLDSDSSYRERVLAQEKQLQDRRISLDEEISRGGLELKREGLVFDRERFASDEGYRDRVLAQENDLVTRRLNFDKDRFRSDEVYRRDVLEQEAEIEAARVELTRDEQEFRRAFDRERFESDESYRSEALAQHKQLADRQSDLQIKELGLRKDQFSSNAYASLRSSVTQASATYQNVVASIMANPDLDGPARQRALSKAKQDYNAVRTEIASLAGPISSEIVWPDVQTPSNLPDVPATATAPDGSSTETATEVDGSITTTKTAPDGSRTTKKTAADGSIATTKTAPDGSRTTKKTAPDGSSTETATAVDGSSTETATAVDGSRTTTSPDGTITRTKPDGTTTTPTGQPFVSPDDPFAQYDFN